MAINKTKMNNKRYKRYKQEKKSLVRLIIIFFAVQILFIVLFVAVFPDEKSLTENDCSIAVGTVEEVNWISTKSRLTVYITIDSKTFYFIPRYMKNNAPSKNLVKELEGEKVTLLVKGEAYIVALSYGGKTYGGIESYNDEACKQNWAKNTGITLFFWLPITVFLIFSIYIKKKFVDWERPKKDETRKTGDLDQ